MWWRSFVLLTLLLAGCQPAPHAPEPIVAVAAPAAPALAVKSVVPEPGSSAVLFNSAVFVQFNRPVVPLTALDRPPTDMPLEIEPPINGSGHWLNTGLFSFTPDVGWAPSTTYHVATHDAEYAWSFTTLPPAIASTLPADSATLVDPMGAVRVTFNQPIDPATVQLTLTPPAAGHTQWPDNRMLVFTPDPALVAGTSYEAQVQLDGTSRSWRFATAPEPAVVRTVPQAEAEAPKLGQVELLFSAPMDPDDVRANLQIEPELDYSPYPQWTENATHATINGGFKPETEYTLRLGAGTHDRYGRALKGAFALSFHTPASQYSPNAPPVPPRAWLISPYIGGTLDAYQHPRALLRTTNVSHFDYSVDALDEATVVRIYNSPPTQNTMPDGRQVLNDGMDVQFERNIPRLSTIDLAQLQPGFYRLRVRPKESAPTVQVQDRLLVVTRTMLAVKQSASQMLVWAVDLKSGKTLSNLPVRILRMDAGVAVASGSTDADGLLQVDLPRTENTRYIAILDRPGDASLAMSSWTGGVGAWAFGIPMQYGPPAQYAAHVYSDRPIYRPGQTVHLKGIVRGDDDAHYGLPPDSFSATWQVRDSQGRTINSGSVSRLSDFGTFDVDNALSTEAVTGSYTFNLQAGEGSKLVASATFLVAEYQRPDFEVSLDAPDAAIGGQAFTAKLRSAYYFGQPLPGADVHWQVAAAPFYFTWAADPTFRFGDADVRAPRRVTAPSNAARAEGKGVTSTDGSSSFQVPTNLRNDEPSQRFTLEATVTDSDHNEVSNRSSIVIHRAGLYVGLKPITLVAQANLVQTVELVTLDVQGQARPGVGVHGQVVRRRWMSVRERDAQGELHWISRPEDMPLSEFDAQSGVDGRGSFRFTPAEGGEYRVIVEAPDAAGNVARTAISVWVGGPGYVPWRINDDGRLELQADKAEYQPGDVAHVIVPAPVANATAVVSVERGRLISHAVQQLAGNSTVLDIPVGEEHVPNAYVSVVLFSGGQSPTQWTGYVELAVSSDDRKLHVTAEPDRREHSPGDTVTYTVSTRDSGGHGVGAEVSLALVDAAVLALADSQSDPVVAFWHRRSLGVQTGSTLGVSIDRLNESASSGLKGGGGGDSATTRQDFPDTAFWSPAVRTDASGFAHVNVHLPDTLTTWRLRAVAVTKDTRIGVATSDVVTSKPLLVRPLAPRFLVGGDTLTVGAAIHNTTSAPVSVTASLDADGLVSIPADTRRSIDVPAGGQVRVDWPVSAPLSGVNEATLHFQAVARGLNDAVDVKVPLLAWGASTTVATAGEVASASTTSEIVDLPRETDPTRGELTVDVAPSLAAALRYSLRQVEEYPYECLEQTVSRFLPRLALQRAINGMGLDDPLNLKADLPGLVSRSIQRIYRYQQPDGGWAWWAYGFSDPYLTAYALSGLTEARRANIGVDQDVVNRAIAYLRQWLNLDSGPYGLETRAYVVYVLGEARQADPSRAATLFDRRAELLPVGKAYLAQALAGIDPTDARVGGLLAELTSAAVVSATGSHWEESATPSRAWIMATDVRTTAAVLDALVRLRPDHPLIPSAVRWLMNARRDEHGFWETTHDTAQSLLTLTDYLAASGELQGNFEWQVGVNGETLYSGTAQARVVAPMPTLSVGSNRVDLIRSVGSGRLYYTLHLRSFSVADEIPYLSHGFTIGREFIKVNDQVHVGDLVQVRLTVMAPAALHDLMLEDPLPAGLEPVDTRLKTTSRAVADAVQASQTRGWQPWTHLDVRSDRVALFANYLSQGAYQYTYVARATLPGEFRILPTNGREQYFPEVFARGDGQHLMVLP